MRVEDFSPPPGMTVHSTPQALAIRARLGYETVEPTMMSTLMVTVCGILATILAFVGAEQDLPPRFPLVFFCIACCFALVFLVAAFFDHAHLRVDARGLTTGVRPLPMSSFPFRRHLSLSQIAGIYVSRCDLLVRFYLRTIHTYEVHALTTAGEPVCLLQRIRQEATALQLAVLIRDRLGPLPHPGAPLRGGIRRASENASQFAGRLPWWLVWLLLPVIGLEPVAIPLARVAGWERASARVVRTDYLYHGRRGCTVRFATTSGAVSFPVTNHCASSVQRGDILTVHYNPRDPASARQLIFPLWPVSVLFCASGLLALILARQRPVSVAGRKVLWKDDFHFVSRFWNLSPENAQAAKGVLTLSHLTGPHAQPNSQFAFEPAALEVKLQAGDHVGSGEGAGILFAAPSGNAGYVFGILPQLQSAFALRLSGSNPSDLISSEFVREISSHTGEWNVLRVDLSPGAARFSVNGASAGSIPFDPPLGGGMAGLYADFAGAATAWRFSNFQVF